MATQLTKYSATSTSIKVLVSGWPSGTGFIRFYIGTVTSDMPYHGYEDVGEDLSCVYTFSGLEPDTAYYIKISPRAATTEQEALESATTVLMYTEPEVTERPRNWSWTSTVSKGAEMPYTRSGNTVYVKPLMAAEWNRFIDRIMDFLEYTGKTWSGNVSSFYATPGLPMTAEKVDYARQIIAVMNPPVALPAAIGEGGRITAAYINGLKNSLNSIE